MVQEVDALNVAIERERGAHQFYSQAASQTGDEAGRQMFMWLAGEEEAHLKLLQKQCNAVRESGQWLADGEAAAGCTLSKPIQSAEFPSLSEVKDRPQADAPEMEILSKAIAAERDAATFYAELAEAVFDPEGKRLLHQLSDIEKGHLALLEEEYEWLRRSKPLFRLHRFTLPSSA